MLHGDPAPRDASPGGSWPAACPVDGQSGRAASLLFYEPAPGADPDDESRRTPWSEAVPDADGTFSVTLPPDRAYRVQPYAFGRPAGPVTSFAVATADADIGDITVTAPARLRRHRGEDGRRAEPVDRTYAELVVVPVPAGTRAAAGDPAPSFYGLFPGCDPMLGPPHGASPACNRALTTDGKFDLLLPPGQYYVYATRGPVRDLDRRRDHAWRPATRCR